MVSGVLNVKNMLAQPSSRKKRRTLAKNRDLLGKFSGNEDEWVKVLRARRRGSLSSKSVEITRTGKRPRPRKR